MTAELHRLTRLCIVVLAIVASSTTPITARAATAEAPTYKIVDFGVLDGSSQSRANAINAGGVAVGVVLTDDPQYVRAVLRRSGKLTELTSAATEDAYASDVNKGRRVAGALRENLEGGGYGPYRAAIWSGSKVTELPPLSGGAAYANAINDDNDVVGYGTIDLDGESRIHAIIWKDNEPADLGTLGEGTTSFAHDINNNGQVVGLSTTEPGSEDVFGTAHAALWDGDDIVDLATLGGDASSAEAINDDGWIVGSSDTTDPDGFNITHAVLWQDGEANDIGAWGDARAASYAFGINGEGLIVGQVENVETRPDTSWFAALWHDGELINLNDVIPQDRGWVLESANDINDKGQIVGQGKLDGANHGFVLTPVVPKEDTARIPPPLIVAAIRQDHLESA